MTLLRSRAVSSALFCALVLLRPPGANGLRADDPGGRSFAVRAGKVYTVAGGVLENATILVRDGRFEAVGTDVEVPPGVRVIDLCAHVIVPGLVDAETTLASDASDTRRSVAPEVNALDGWDFFAERRELLKGGVTAVYVAPGIAASSGRSARLISGWGGVVKTAGHAGDPRRRVLKSPSGLQLSLGEISSKQPSIYDPPVGASPDNPFEALEAPLPQSRAGEYLALRRLLRRAGSWARSLSGKGEIPEWDLESSAFYPLFSAGDHLRVRARKAHDIFRMIELAKEHGVRMVLESGAEAAYLAPFLVEEKIPVIFAGAFRPGRIPSGDLDQPTTEGLYDEKAFLSLARAGVQVVLHSPTDGEVKELLLQAATAVGMGIEREEALRAITLTPAEVLGVDGRIGSIAPGKDADFAVLGGDPFSGEGRPQAVVIGGEVVYEEAPAIDADATAVLCGRIHTGTGREIPGGLIVVKGGKIEYVGPGAMLSRPERLRELEEGGRLIDASRYTVVPGFIDCGSTAGTHAESLALAARAASGGAGARGGPNFRLAEAVDPRDPALTELVASGITTVLVAPEPSGTVSGQMSALKLAAAEPEKAVLREYAAMLFGGTSTTEVKKAKAYHDRWRSYEEKKAAARSPGSAGERAPEAKKGSGKEGSGKKGAEGTAGSAAKSSAGEPKREERYEPFRPLFEGKVAAVLPARDRASVESVLKTFREGYGMRVILYGLTGLTRPEDFDAAADAIRRLGHGVLLDGPLVAQVDRKAVNRPRELVVRGVPLAFRSRAAAGARFLPLQVAYAVNEGLDAREALRAMTHEAALRFGIENRVGSIEKGKDADLVFLVGEPFSMTTRVAAVMVDGRLVFEAKNERTD